MKIYTKTGDCGMTSLLGGARVSKTDPRICALGDLDELNAWLGVVKTLVRKRKTHSRLLRPAKAGLAMTQTILRQAQDDIHHIMTEIADERSKNGKIKKQKSKSIGPENIKYLEMQIDFLAEKLPMPRKFVIPGDNSFEAHCHLARTVCRRAERTVVALNKRKKLKNANIIPYLNRLSDLLFMLARYEK